MGRSWTPPSLKWPAIVIDEFCSVRFVMRYRSVRRIRLAVDFGQSLLIPVCKIVGQAQSEE